MQQDGVVYCTGGGIRNYVIVREGSQLGYASAVKSQIVQLLTTAATPRARFVL